ncbi:DDE-type integrase/transposase/recombinase [Variovorax sp. YR266]|uniref:DDE-type integrase/transposase/recombinase n=1 Tax=Variovorax sp. YR266 TaxID=1884386 RepID=UPI000B861ED3
MRCSVDRIPEAGGGGLESWARSRLPRLVPHATSADTTRPLTWPGRANAASISTRPPESSRPASPSRPDLVWVADFTYIRIETGFCYLAAILDACSRKVVGYAISRRIDTPLALAALYSAGRSRQPQSGCIHHTDCGCQYASETYRRALQEAGLLGSMSSPGNPYHNAQAESFMKTLKVEEVYLAGYETFADVATRLPQFTKRSTTPNGCIRRSATVRPTNSNPNSFSRRLSPGDPSGPVDGVHSMTYQFGPGGLRS